METALPLHGPLLGTLRHAILAPLALSVLMCSVNDYQSTVPVTSTWSGPDHSPLTHVVDSLQLPSRRSDDPFYAIVPAAQVPVLMILRKGARHVLAMKLVEHAQIIMSFCIVRL